VVGVGGGIGGGEAKAGPGVAEAAKGVNGCFIGGGSAPLVGVAGKALDAYEQNDVATPGDALRGLGGHEGAVCDGDEEQATVAGHEIEHVVSQQRLATGDDNGEDPESLRFCKESVKLVGRELIVHGPAPRVAA